MNYQERNKLLDKVSLIGLMMIFVELFLYGVDYCYTKRLDVIGKMPVILNVFWLIFLAISVGLFVYIKKKDKKELKIYAIEFLVLAFVCPFITYLYYPKFFGLHTNFIHKIITHHTLWIGALLYYAGRIVYVLVKAYQKSPNKKLKKKKAN